jgi:hypothetical protein
VARSPRLPALLGAAVLLTLAGCSPAEPDPDTVDAWVTEATDAADADPATLAFFAAPLARDTSFDDADGIQADFVSTEAVTGVELSCVGEGSMRFEITTGDDDSAASMTTDPLACAGSPHVLSPEEVLSGATGITSIAVDAAESDRASAWAAVVRGDAAPGE